MNDVIRDTVKNHNKQPGKIEWRVLVVDSLSMKTVSACTKMHELSAEGITSELERDSVSSEVTPNHFSRGDHREEKGAHASYGSHLSDWILRLLRSVVGYVVVLCCFIIPSLSSEMSPAGLFQSE